MSKLDELIQQLCPDGVEYKPLGEVCDTNRGERVTKKQLLEKGLYPVVSGGVNPMGYIDKYNRLENTITIAQYGSAGYVHWQIEKFWANDVCYSLFPNESLNNRFLYHFLKKSCLKIDSMVNRDAVPYHLPQIRLESLSIPLPPLPVQEEIVRILDKFTEITAELKAELKARKDEYDYYRNQLLSFDASRTDVEWNILGESCNIIKGEYITKKETTAGNIPVILGGQEPAYYIDKSNHEGKGIVISRSGASAGYVSFWDEPIFVTDGFLVEPKDETLLIEFLYYFLKNKQPYIQSLKRGAGVPHITSNHISDLKVIIPPLAEQQRIVDILDRFEKLTNDMTEGIPAEIEATRQMYEYYRNQLLDFKKKED